MDSFLRIRHFTPPRVCAKLVINNPLLFMDTGMARFLIGKYRDVGRCQFPTVGVVPTALGLNLRTETTLSFFGACIIPILPPNCIPQWTLRTWGVAKLMGEENQKHGRHNLENDAYTTGDG
jgi:hypothetical protein